MSKKPSDSNIIYVGRKPPMNYVLGIVTAFSGTDTNEVTVKARGQAITTAVDAVEIARRRFVKEMKVDKIDIGTEEMPPREGESNSRMISTIEITLKRQLANTLYVFEQQIAHSVEDYENSS